MQNKIGKGLSHSTNNSLLVDADDVSDNAFTVEIKFSYPADFYWKAGETYLDMFGVNRDDQTMRSWALFVMQYESNATENYIFETAEYFRTQNYFQKQAAIPNVSHYTLQINVPRVFIKMLSDFGIEVSFNPATKNVSVTKFNPIKMIAWSDLKPADILCVGGHLLPSKIIKAGTWSSSSHTAMFEGGNYVLESLSNGITRTSKANLLNESQGVNVILVKRHRFDDDSKASEVVKKAKDNVNDGDGLMGTHPKKYNWLGLAGAGVSSPSGAIIGAASTAIIPIVPIAIGLNEANNLARETVNAIPDAAILLPNEAGKVVTVGKMIWGGEKGRLFCTEAVITWYNEAGYPITNMRPDLVPPKLVAENYFNNSLKEIGYLRYMP
jgi:hypothetical protein